jgi:hypothetical protein
LKIAPDHTLITKWSYPGQAPGAIAGPTGISVENSLVYVADHLNERVDVFTTDGIYVSEIWERGLGSGAVLGTDSMCASIPREASTLPTRVTIVMGSRWSNLLPGGRLAGD